MTFGNPGQHFPAVRHLECRFTTYFEFVESTFAPLVSLCLWSVHCMCHAST